MRRKNLRLLAGRPLVVWTIRAALGAASLDRVVVSSESPALLKVARRAGAETIRRPAALAIDAARSAPVALHALQKLRRADRYQPDVVALLQPTSPLRTSLDIERAVRLMQRRRASAVVSVARGARGAKVRGLRPNGAIYLTRRDTLLRSRTFFPRGVIGFPMPLDRSVDIDTKADFSRAEALLKVQQGRRRSVRS